MLLLLFACEENPAVSEKPEEIEDSAFEDAADVTDVISNEVDTSLCEDDYALCGQLNIPSDFAGTPRALSVALYEEIPPAGPPLWQLKKESATPNQC
jgi:hypothetical protein